MRTRLILVVIILVAQPAQAEIPQATAVKVIIGEGANQGLNGMTAIAEVMRRRGSVKPFSAAKRRDLDRFVKKQGPKVYQQAKKAWKRSKTSDITKGADHYENVKKFGKPWWAKRMVKTTKIKDHQFYSTKGKYAKT